MMGNSLHNKIYLGRRAALLNVKRAQLATLIGASTGAIALLWLVTAIK